MAKNEIYDEVIFQKVQHDATDNPSALASQTNLLASTLYAQSTCIKTYVNKARFIVDSRS